MWYRNDLRVDDHPGLVAAAGCGSRLVVPIFVLDAQQLSYLAYVPGGPEGTCTHAVQYRWAGGCAERQHLRAQAPSEAPGPAAACVRSRRSHVHVHCTLPPVAYAPPVTRTLPRAAAPPAAEHAPNRADPDADLAARTAVKPDRYTWPCLDVHASAPLAVAAVLASALAQLRQDLRALGSDLLVRRGAWGGAAAQLAQQLGGVRAVVSQQEAEFRYTIVVGYV